MMINILFPLLQEKFHFKQKSNFKSLKFWETMVYSLLNDKYFVLLVVILNHLILIFIKNYQEKLEKNFQI